MSAGNGGSTNGANGNGLDAVLKPRAEWLAKRKAENTDGNFSQMHYARQEQSPTRCNTSLIEKRLRRNWCAMKSLADA